MIFTPHVKSLVVTAVAMIDTLVVKHDVAARMGEHVIHVHAG
jgi:hypothetical protein